MDETCQMMLNAPGEGERRCDASPTVGGNGLYRYCERHMRMVADAGATTLVWDSGTASGASSRRRSAPPWLRHGAREHRHRHHPRLYLRPQHIGPSAVVVGVTAYLLASLLPWWWAVVAIAGLLQLVVTVGQRVEVDRTPPARLLRR